MFLAYQILLWLHIEEMCGTRMERRNLYNMFLGKLEWKSTFGGLGRGWEVIVKNDNKQCERIYELYYNQQMHIKF
jgi:hypothetical protein